MSKESDAATSHNMEIESMQARIDKLSTLIFLLAMKDHWDNADYEQDRMMKAERGMLIKKLTEIEITGG